MACEHAWVFPSDRLHGLRCSSNGVVGRLLSVHIRTTTASLSPDRYDKGKLSSHLGWGRRRCGGLCVDWGKVRSTLVDGVGSVRFEALGARCSRLGHVLFMTCGIVHWLLVISCAVDLSGALCSRRFSMELLCHLSRHIPPVSFHCTFSCVWGGSGLSRERTGQHRPRWSEWTNLTASQSSLCKGGQRRRSEGFTFLCVLHQVRPQPSLWVNQSVQGNHRSAWLNVKAWNDKGSTFEASFCWFFKPC